MRLVDLTGQRFGRLLVIERSAGRYVSWLCKCDCGNEKVVTGQELIKGKTKSCGCLRKETTSQMRRKHGQKGTRLYMVWASMKERCTNPKNKGYPSYGGRGIEICEEWLHNFEAFYEWSMANGYDESAPRGQCTIDRIDNNGNYEPLNCRWVSMVIQNKNKRAPNGFKIKEN